MATGTIPNPHGLVPVLTDGACAKQGRFVTMSYRTWQTASSVTVPAGYRPWSDKFFVAEQRDANDGPISVERMIVKTDGTITLNGNNAKFVGTFTWAIY